MVSAAPIVMLKPYKQQVLTITGDNSKDFSGHEEIAHALVAEFYFAHPYSSWEWGLDENTNDLIRQYCFSKNSFCDVDKELLDAVQSRRHNQPRRTLDYYTPANLFLNSSFALGT